MNDRISINDLTSEQLNELYDDLERYEEVVVGDLNEVNIGLARQVEQLRAEADAWRRKAIRRALGTSKLRGALDGCRDLIGEDVTRSDAWGDGYREAISDLREVLQAFGQLEPTSGEWLRAGTRDLSIPAHDGPSVAEAAADDRKYWADRYAGEGE